MVSRLQMKVPESEHFGPGISVVSGLKLKQSDDLSYILGLVSTKVKVQQDIVPIIN